MLQLILKVIGWYLVLRAAYGMFRIIQELFLLKELDLADRYGKGSWAFITGSTDGIGLEFAIQLAKRGFNIALLARNKQKMNEKEDLIKKANPSVQVRKIEIDFKDSADVALLEKIVEDTKDIDISMLINNVGVGTMGTPVLDMKMQTALDMIVINCIPQAIFDRLLLPRLWSRSKRGCVLDVSSVASLANLPGKEIYSASKFFNKAINNSFAMAGAIRKDNVDYLTLKPGFVKTGLTGEREIDAITCDTTQCVLGALKALGQKSETFGASKHVLFGGCLELLFFLVPLPVLLKYRNTLYGLVKYKAFTNASVAQ